MSERFLDNSLFRNIYCYLAGDSDACAMRGYTGFFPAGLEWLAFLITALAISAIVATAFLQGLLGFLWVERRLLGRFQNRIGPNRWGPFGLLTPVADALKFLFKEDVVPRDADRLLYNLAPVMIFVPILIVWSVLPLGAGTFIVDLNISLLFVLGITSMGALAIMMAGWASGNRISVFSSLRGVATLISYEIPAGLSLVGVIMLAGSLSLGDIVAAQQIPFILVQPLAFFVFFVTSLAEINRTPFDLTEAESELAAGHLNDYSSMKFGLLFIGEYAATITAAALIVTVFLSGWRGWSPIPSHLWFLVKLGGVLFVIIWVRSTWPRFRIDQMLNIAWKGLFELTFINIIVTAILIAIFPQPSVGELWIMVLVNWVVFVSSLWIVGKFLGKRKTSPLPVVEKMSLYPVAPAEGERNL